MTWVIAIYISTVLLSIFIFCQAWRFKYDVNTVDLAVFTALSIGGPLSLVVASGAFLYEFITRSGQPKIIWSGRKCK